MRFKELILLFGFVLIGAKVFSQDCYESVIVKPVPFMGNNDEIFKLSDGTIWEILYEYE
jgi:hypothetical protein